MVIQMISCVDIKDRSNLGVLLREIASYLKKKYHYFLDGLYDVEIYQYMNYFIFEIEKVGEYSSIDFDITFHPNHQMLVEFYDEDYIQGKKYFYDGKYYIDFKLASLYFDCFEFCKVIYKEDVETVLKNAIVVF